MQLLVGARLSKKITEAILAVLTTFVIVVDSSAISEYITGADKLKETETLSAFTVAEVGNERYIVDNLDAYKEIDRSEHFVIKLSPNNNKVHIEYTNNADNGVVVVVNPLLGEHSCRVDKNTYIEFKDGDGVYKIKKFVLKDNSSMGLSEGVVTVNVENSDSITSNLGNAYEINGDINNGRLLSMIDTVWGKSTNSIDYINKCYTEVSKINYDDTKATNIINNKYFIYKSYVTETLNNNTGICLDKAALLANMLRYKGIPTRIVRGYYKEEYHAWVEVYYNNEWHPMDPTIYTTDGVNYLGDYRISKYT